MLYRYGTFIWVLSRNRGRAAFFSPDKIDRLSSDAFAYARRKHGRLRTPVNK